MVMGTGGIGTWILAERARSAEPASARTAARSAAARPLSRARHRRAAKVGAVAGTDGTTPLDMDRLSSRMERWPAPSILYRRRGGLPQARILALAAARRHGVGHERRSRLRR